MTFLQTLHLDVGSTWLASVDPTMDTTIPESLGNLKQLEVLHLRLVNLSGTIPQSLGSHTNYRFKELHLSSAVPSGQLSITGTLPSGLLGSNLLEKLVLDQTSLTFIPRSYHWDLLRELVLTDNSQLEFDIYFPLQQLRRFVLQGSPLVTGGMYLPQMPLIEEFEVTSNSFALETNSWSWQFMPNLRKFYADMALYSGFLTSDIGSLRDLESFIVISPLFTGTIPREIANCTRLDTLMLTSAGLTGPLPSPLGAPNMATLVIRDASNLGSLPASIIPMPNMASFVITSSGLNGTLPSWLDGFKSRLIELNDNQLEGSLPKACCSICRLNGNNFTGEIPLELASSAISLEIQHNSLGPRLGPDNIFTRTWDGGVRVVGLTMDVSFNSFYSLLPPVIPSPSTLEGLMLQFSNNRFYGTIPDSWKAYNMDVSYNDLNGDLGQLLPTYSGGILILTGNDFEGTIPPFISTPRLYRLAMSDNKLSGPIPPLPPSLTSFEASGNQLSGILSPEFIFSVTNSRHLVSLDLGDNSLECVDHPSPSLLLISGPLKSLKLAHNNFSCNFFPLQFQDRRTDLSPMLALDLSYNFFTGNFQPNRLESLVVLDISHNRFTGPIEITSRVYQAITQIDVSFNRFTTDVSKISNLPYLFSFNARNNSFTGSLILDSMPKLTTLDMSNNALNAKPSLASIGLHFQLYSLKSLSIKNNTLLPRIKGFDTAVTGLNISRLPYDSIDHPGVVCRSLTFFGLEGITFEFDEDLFDFIQCECDTKHFGSPPNDCQICPSLIDLSTGSVSGIQRCGGQGLTLSPNSFLVVANASNEPNDVLSSFGSVATTTTLQFESETCLVLPEQILTQHSNCLGLTLTASELRNRSAIHAILEHQCRLGSTGRLCARCMCSYGPGEPEGGECYYEKSLRCVKCSRVLTPKQYVLLGLCLLMASIIIVTAIFLIVLPNKRIQRTQPWTRLALPRRAFYRLLYLISLGNVPILIGFLQIFMELTHWDAYVLGRVLQLVNLNAESLGLTCLFPFMSHPETNLAVRLYLPLVALVIVGLCIGLAELVSRCFNRLTACRPSSHDHPQMRPQKSTSGTHGVDDVDSEDYLLLNDSLADDDPLSSIPHEKITTYESKKVIYPTAALLTTVLISVIRFVYFGTALSAHEYLFSIRDPSTGHSYVQSYPYLRSDGTMSSVWMSLPIMILLDGVLPIGFILLCIFGRNKIVHPRTALYFGSLFEPFTSQCYWWEIVIIFKKLSIALVLRGVPSSDALQVTLIVTVISGIMLLQVSLRPWRRQIENIADSCGSLILIGALLAARSGRFHDSNRSVYYVAALTALYVVASVIVICVQTFFGTTEYEKRIARLQAELASESGIDEEGEKLGNRSKFAATSSYLTEDDGTETEESSE